MNKVDELSTMIKHDINIDLAGQLNMTKRDIKYDQACEIFTRVIGRVTPNQTGVLFWYTW